MDADAFDIDDADDFRGALGGLLMAGAEAGVSEDAMAGLLTAYLARLRGDVRLPLGMEPDRARQFRERAGEHLRETMQVELVVTPAVLDELDLQLSAFDADELPPDSPGEPPGDADER